MTLLEENLSSVHQPSLGLSKYLLYFCASKHVQTAMSQNATNHVGKERSCSLLQGNTETCTDLNETNHNPETSRTVFFPQLMSK